MSHQTLVASGSQPPLKGEEAKAFVDQLVPATDSKLPEIPNVGRSPFDQQVPEPTRPRKKLVLPSPGTIQPAEPPLAQPSNPIELPKEAVPSTSLPEPGSLKPDPLRPDR